MAESALLWASIELCRETLKMQRTLGPFTSANGVGQIVTAADERVANLLAVRVDGVPLDVVTIDALDKVVRQSGYPTMAFLASSATVGFEPAPATGSDVSFTVRVATMPTMSAQGIDDDVAIECGDLIALGALSRIMAHQGKSYSDATQAQLYKERFVAGLSEEKTAVFRKNSRSSGGAVGRIAPVFF